MPLMYDVYTYTVYRNGNDTPIAERASAEECARIMGIKVSSFKSIARKVRIGDCRKWRIVRSSDGTAEKKRPVSYEKSHKLTDIDIEVIEGLYCGGYSMNKLAMKMHVTHPVISYHVAKIRRVTGLNPRVPNELEMLVNKFLRGK